jgi:uncharacterized protein (DUF169 family)
MKFEELSKKLRSTLKLEDSPVGVKLIKVGEELPEIAKLAKGIPYCESVARARKGEVVLLGKDKHGCPLGAAILGLRNFQEKMASGEAHFSARLSSSPVAASKTVSEIPRIPAETIQATLVFPLEKAPLEPEVVILYVKPYQAMWVALALNYSRGGRISSTFAGIGSICGDATVIPYMKNNPNFTPGDFGGRKLRVPEEMIVGIPISLLEESATNLEKMGCPRLEH